MVQYASGSIKFSGLGTDTDFQEMIDKLYSIETRYANQLLRWKADWQQRLEAFQQVRAELLNLQTTLTSLNSMSKFLVKAATSSDEKVATAIAGADTLNGTYSLDVQQLASQYSWSKNTGLYEKNDVVAEDNGVFQYRYKGVERTLYIPKGTTIEGLKNIINNDSQNPGVKAQLINTQDGIVFQLHSQDTGSSNTLIIQDITNMSALGSITLTNQKYIEAENSMMLAQGFTSTSDIINSGTDNKTFVFSVDGKKKSISVPPGATIQWLTDEINAWGAAHISSQNNERIASLELDTDGLYYFKIEKRDSVYGAGVYNDDLLDVLTSSYASGNEAVFTSGPDRTYKVSVIPPEGSPYDITVTLSAGETLDALRGKFQQEIDNNGYNTTVGITTDPDDSGRVKLTFGPVASQAMQDKILDVAWDSDTQLIDTTVAMQYMIRLTNSDVGGSDADIMKISLPAGAQCTIRAFCDSINAALGNKGTARLVADDANPGKWKVVIETNSASHRVTVEDGSLDSMKYELPSEASGDWLIVSGQNAKIRVNGWPKEPDYLESASNNIAAGDMIDGMSVTLRGTGSTVISVANDTTKIAENVTTFVTAVNNFRTLLQSLTAYDEEKATLDPDYAESQFEMQKGSVLTGNYGIQMLSSRLKNAVASSAMGFVHQAKDSLTGYVSGDIFSALSQIGITTNADQGSANYGLLEINTIDGEKGLRSLERVLAQNPEAVARLFSTRSEGSSNNQDLFQHNSHVAGIAKAGTYSVEYTVALDSGNNPYIDTAFINGQPAKIDNVNKQISLVAPEGDPARSIVLDVYDLTVGVTRKGSVSIKEGKVNELLAMMDGTEGLLGSGGTLKNLEKNYQTIIENIEKKIKQEDDRLVKWRRTMDLKFSRLEAVLAKYNSINDSLKTQLAQLSNQNKSS